MIKCTFEWINYKTLQVFFCLSKILPNKILLLSKKMCFKTIFFLFSITKIFVSTIVSFFVNCLLYKTFVKKCYHFKTNFIWSYSSFRFLCFMPPYLIVISLCLIRWIFDKGLIHLHKNLLVIIFLFGTFHKIYAF